MTVYVSYIVDRGEDTCPMPCEDYIEVGGEVLTKEMIANIKSKIKSIHRIGMYARIIILNIIRLRD